MTPHKLSPRDRWFWRAHTPTTPSIIAAVVELGSELTIDDARALLRERLGPIERMQARVVDEGWSSHWVRDETFSIEAHVHDRGTIADAGDAELATLWARVGEIVAEPLDPSRSPWSFDLLRRPGRGTVVVARLHHALADGVALLMVLLALADPSAEVAAELGLSAGENPLAALFAGEPHAARAARPYVERLMPAARELLLRGHGAPAWAVPLIGAKGMLEVARLMLGPNDPRQLRGARVTPRRVAWSAGASVAGLKESSHALGVTLNDLLLSAVAGALRRYLLETTREPPRDIRVGVPVSLRPLERMAALGNQIGMLYVPLPLEAASPRERLAELRRRVERLKRSGQPFAAFATMSLMGAGPTWTSRLLAELLAHKSRALMTNVPGPVRPLHFVGAPIDNLVFWVPTTSVGLGISVISYAGVVRIGLMSAPTVVPEPARLAALFDDELELLRDLA